MRTRAAYGVVLGLLGLVGACGSGTEVETFYPLTSGRNWSYVLLLRQGTEADARTVETSSRVTNLPPQTFQAATVTPQQTQAFGQTQVRLIRANAEGVAEVAMQPDPAGSPLPRVPPNYILRLPLQMGASWQSTWQSNQFSQTTLIPMTKTVARTDGKISLPAGEFEGCLVLSIQGHGQVTAPSGPVEVTVEGEEWFSPGVGLIKGSFREDVAGQPDNATRIDINLASFNR